MDLASGIKWNLKDQPDEIEIQALMNAVNASQTLAVLMHQRGIRDFETARQYFNPEIKQLHNPFSMKGMDKAVNRISKAIENEERILVYGDYDVDGTTAVALVYDFLSKHTELVSYYIPDRYSEGYGISLAGIDFAADNEFSLIVALDCGIKAIDQVNYAQDKGIDFIICDHHLPSSVLPSALAILNPLQPDCEYPYKHLSGCGIGFKLIQALTQSWDADSSVPYMYLDLVAIAAGCDIVPMTGENRVLCHFGLKLLNETRRPGIEFLLENGGRIVDGQLKKQLTITDLVFVIGPRINAAGRMAHGSKAVELLTSNTSKSAEKSADEIVKNNKDRMDVDKQMLEEALAMLDTNPSKHSTVLYAPHWHKGVVGIVASRIQEHFYRPTIILTESNGKVTGSARSVQGFDVHEAIKACDHLIENFGGHKAAAGLTLHPKNLEDFIERFEIEVKSRIQPDQLIPSLEIDCEIEFATITRKFFDSMNRLAPFGPQNMRPVFVAHNLIDAGGTRRVGDGSHLKLEVKQVGGNKVMKGIAFGKGDYESSIKSGKPFSAALVIEENVFRGLKSIELMIKDLKFTD